MTFEEPTPTANAQAQMERFVQATTESLASNPELQHAAREQLRRTLADASELDESTARLTKPVSRWKLWLAPVLIAAILVPIWGHSLWQWREFSNLYLPYSASFGFVHPGSNFPSAYTPITDRLTSDERLILCGAPAEADQIARWKPLADRFPDNPAYFAQYAVTCLNRGEPLPKNFDATVKRIDPDNGWFLALKALEAGRGSYKRARTKGSLFTITDRARLDAALALLHSAITAPTFRSYEGELLDQRSQLLPPRRDRLMQVRCTFLISDSQALMQADITLHFYIRAALDDAAANSQPARVHELLNDWELYQKRMSESERSSLLTRLIERSNLGFSAKGFSATAGSLSLEPEGSRLKNVTEWLETEQKRRSTLPRSPGNPLDSALLEFLDSSNTTFNRYSANWPPKGEDPMKHARAADQALIGRILMFACSLLLLPIAGLVALHRFRHGVLIRKVSASLQGLMDKSDAAWILTLGLLAPVAWLFVIRLGPWGGTDSLISFALPRTIGPQFLLMLFTVLMAVSLTCRWRCLRRMPWLKPGLGSAWFTWGCLAFTVVTMPLMQLWTRNPEWEDRTLLIPAAVPFLWLLVAMTRALFFTADFPLGGVVVSRVVSRSLPACAAGFALMVGAFYLEERRQIETDPLANDPSNIFAAEVGLSRIINDENRMLLEMLEKD